MQASDGTSTSFDIDIATYAVELDGPATSANASIIASSPKTFRYYAMGELSPERNASQGMRCVDVVTAELDSPCSAQAVRPDESGIMLVCIDGTVVYVDLCNKERVSLGWLVAALRWLTHGPVMIVPSRQRAAKYAHKRPAVMHAPAQDQDVIKTQLRDPVCVSWHPSGDLVLVASRAGSVQVLDRSLATVWVTTHPEVPPTPSMDFGGLMSGTRFCVWGARARATHSFLLFGDDGPMVASRFAFGLMESVQPSVALLLVTEKIRYGEVRLQAAAGHVERAISCKLLEHMSGTHTPSVFSDTTWSRRRYISRLALFDS